MLSGEFVAHSGWLPPLYSSYHWLWRHTGMPEPSKPNEEASSEDRDEIALTSSGEVVLKPNEMPPKGEPGKRIHPRRPLPPIPEGKPDQTGSPEPEESVPKPP
jgi:hypothetical protein